MPRMDIRPQRSHRSTVNTSGFNALCDAPLDSLAAYWPASRAFHSWFKFRSRLEAGSLDDEANLSTTPTANDF